MTDSREFLLSSYRYDLDTDLIAQSPATPRDSARLLVYDRAAGRTEHGLFRDLLAELRSGDMLVVNTTRVIRARLHPTRPDGGGAEVLLVRPRTASAWEAMVRPGRRLKPGTALRWDDGTRATVGERLPEGMRLVEFSREVDADWLESVGAMPLPPYIRRPQGERNEADDEDYQTVYADEPGAVAAPTAGLHFTEPLLGDLAAKGVDTAHLVLHVGPGTFRPVRVDDIRTHTMDYEYYNVPAPSLQKLGRTRRAGGRIVAVGTTSVRTLEALANDGFGDDQGEVPDGGISGKTDVFIYPPHTFRLVDAMITNFHLPESTLLMLVSAFAGRERTLALYGEAIERRYRFYSYGDAMLLL